MGTSISFKQKRKEGEKNESEIEKSWKGEKRMVLWEIAVGTAYFLGLKRTYRLALRIQRRLVSPKHPKIRQFLHRYVFFF